MVDNGAALVVASMDTKGREVEYLCGCFHESGVAVLTLDAGVLGDTPFPVTVNRQEVALAGGASLADLRKAEDEGKAITVMQEGCGGMGSASLPGRPDGGHYLHRRFNGYIPRHRRHASFSSRISEGHDLDHGVGNTRPFVGTRDILMLYSVCDFSG